MFVYEDSLSDLCTSIITLQSLQQTKLFESLMNFLYKKELWFQLHRMYVTASDSYSQFGVPPTLICCRFS